MSPLTIIFLLPLLGAFLILLVPRNYKVIIRAVALLTTFLAMVQAIYAFCGCFVMTIVISLATPKTKTDEELKGLVYSLTPRIKEHGIPWYKQPATLAVIVLIATVALNIIFR